MIERLKRGIGSFFFAEGQYDPLDDTLIDEALEDAPHLEVTAVDGIEMSRINSFLKTHWLLCAVVLVAGQIELLLVDMTLRAYLGGIAVVVVSAAFILYYQRQLARGDYAHVDRIVPTLIIVDTLVVFFQLWNEQGLDTGWAATPALLVFMLPMFTRRHWLVLLVGGVQIALYLGLNYAITKDWLPYEAKPLDDPSSRLKAAFGHAFLVFVAMMLAGRSSIAMVRSNELLKAAALRAANKVAAAEQFAEQQQRMATLGALSASIAHEISNPLTFARTNLSSLREDFADLLAVLAAYGEADGLIEAQRPQLHRTIQAHVEHLCLDDPEELVTLIVDADEGMGRVQEIIEQLRIFTRFDEVKGAPVTLLEGIHSVLTLQKHRLMDIVVTQTGLEDLPLAVAVPGLVTQVWDNLISNAIHAIEGTGRIWIDGRVESIDTPVELPPEVDDGGVIVDPHAVIVVEVCDDGPGVPVEIRGRIFESRYSTKRVGEGMGMGLSLCAQILERVGGTISVSDRPGGGACFRVTFPKVA